jgi:uncharacterized protein (DUF2141 family)
MNALNRTIILLSLFVGFGWSTNFAQTIDLTVTNIDSPDGFITIGIYQDQSTFDEEKASITKHFPKGANVVNSTLKTSFTLNPGVYGITLLDDENSDKKMNYNWIGWPKEGFGFSNIYHTGWSKPKFDSFKFTLSKGQRLAVTVKVRYM